MNITEAENLIGAIIGCNEDYEAQCMSRFGVGLETFGAIAEELIPLTLSGRSAITNEPFRGYVKDGWFIVKRP